MPKALAKWRTDDCPVVAVYLSWTKHLPSAPYNSVFDDNCNRSTGTLAWIEGRYDGHVMGDGLRARVACDDNCNEGNLVQSIGR
ncbi:MAG: hypothetical protein ABI777_06690 [Betaproteobacteria bacterium]